MNDRTVKRLVVWLRWVAAVIVAVAVSLMIVSTTIHEAELNGCERTQNAFEKMATALEVASANSESLEEAYGYRALVRDIREEFVDCEDAYPPPIPFVR